jgi:hypothetical protein
VTVAQLLSASRAAHLAYQGEQRKQPANYAVCERYVAEALRLRSEAHAADPQHVDAAWRDDKVPHAELVAFYARYLVTL